MSEKDAAKQLSAALGRIPSGLFILTARSGKIETGMLTSWVQQCSFEPPQVTVAVRKGRELLDWLRNGSTFTLNILDDSQTDMIVHFGRGFALDEPAFAGLAIKHAPGGPVLSEALAYLECRVTSRCEAGDHELLVAQVTSGRLLGEGQPMVHVRKSGTHY